MNNLLLLFSFILLSLPPIEHASAAQSDRPTTLVWPDGTRYVGGVLDGKRSGKGTIFWQDGTRFIGQFENDMRNGPGTMILPDGTVYTGFFENDELIDAQARMSAKQSDPAFNAAQTIAALGDTELPIEADSLFAKSTAKATNKSDEFEPVAAAEINSDLVTTATTTEAIDKGDESAQNKPGARYKHPSASDITSVTDTVKDELIEAIDLWRDAWSGQNASQYLSNYSENFEVPGNQSRQTWEALRRTRLTKPRYIKLKIDYKKFELIDTNVVDVFFQQNYRSNTYSDQTNKVLRLSKEGKDWKILLERSR